MNVSICIPTFKRPLSLERLLKSLSCQKFNKVVTPRVKIIVVDNDASLSAKPVIEKIRQEIENPILYEVERKRGIPHVRNKLVELSKKFDFIAFIDDDEEASPEWLDELLYIQKKYNADVVMGPVLPFYEKSPPQWMIDGRFHASDRFETGSHVGYLNTGNLLINSKILDKFDKPFEERMALTGGTDGNLGRKFKKIGINFIWADNAIVKEIIPVSRMKIEWLLKRRYRVGNTEPLSLHYSNQQYICLKSVVRALRLIFIGIVKSMTFILCGKAALIKGLEYIVQGIGIMNGLLGLNFKEYQSIHGK